MSRSPRAPKQYALTYSNSKGMFKGKAKGMELQVTFLVVIIISIVIFASGLYLVRQFFKATSAFQEQIDENTAKEIERRLAESGEKVSIPINLKTFTIGDTQAFGLGVLNTLTPDKTCQVFGQTKPCNKFGIMVKFITAVDARTGNPTTETTFADSEDIENSWIPSSFPPIELIPNQLKVVSIPVRVGNAMKTKSPVISTRRDTMFIFNVCVFKRYEDSLDLGNAPSCKDAKPLFVQNALYGNRVLKMIVKVA